MYAIPLLIDIVNRDDPAPAAIDVPEQPRFSSINSPLTSQYLAFPGG